jgi:cellulose synthase/poly-beta-1,6-N-acetylglucosamine synthase-like glycosyltransferase
MTLFRAQAREIATGHAASTATERAVLDLLLTRRFLPRRRDGIAEIATSDASAQNIAWLTSTFASARIVVVSKAVLLKESIRRFGAQLTDDAVFAHARASPLLSARRVMTRRQMAAIGVLSVAVAIPLWAWPMRSLGIFVVLMALGFVVSISFRGMLAWIGGNPAAAESDEDMTAGEDSLPLYTILVPLYREAHVVPRLIRALGALDYPPDKLDIKLIVEADDETTAAIADLLDGQGPFEVVRVPPSLPRTKPKATNFALRFARGEFLVIYDAEDRPEPDQLRKALAKFRQLPRETACLQARLNFYNANENWLTRMFALDYALWFDVLLPGLDRIGVPMPLGGTSNHFRTHVLRAAGAWDPFNVTEDADLGIRFAQLGYRVSMLDSTTFEEAPTKLGVWIRQRTRWLKGYMQTWLVHDRDPAALIRRAGPGGFLAFQLFIGGAVFSALVNPLLWLVFVASSFFDLPLFGAGHAAVYISASGLLIGNGLLAYLSMIGPRRRGWPELAPYGLTIALYWILISIAGYRALWQLVTRPFYWEKTTHGLSRQAAEGGDA